VKVYYDAELEQQIAEAAQALVDVALRNHQDYQSGETFQSCLMCGSWDEHQTGCPMPLLEEWLAWPQWSPKG